jgi:uncharacterized membrane-anchored protein YhcB (DUF1043 family)
VDILIGFLMVIIAVAGFFAGRYFAPNQQEINDLNNQLAEKDAEHQKYRELVAEHVAGSARKFNKITQEYRELYEHLATGAHDLCERRAIPRELSTTHVNILAVESPSSAPQLESDTSESSEPTVVDVSKAGLSPISQTNQAILDEHISNKDSTKDSADIINLDEQRVEPTDEDLSPAKDYAVKEKGVINHNSLNRDDVKT